MVVKKSTVDLTDSAKSVVERLRNRWPLRTILSAGVVAFDQSTAEEREMFVDMANGIKLEQPGVVCKILSADESEDLRMIRNLLGPEGIAELKCAVADENAAAELSKGILVKAIIGG